MYFKLIFLTLIIIILPACNNLTNEIKLTPATLIFPDSETIKLHEVCELKTPKTIDFFRSRGTKIKNEHLYILEYQLGNVLKYRLSGDYVGSVLPDKAIDTPDRCISFDIDSQENVLISALDYIYFYNGSLNKYRNLYGITSVQMKQGGFYAICGNSKKFFSKGLIAEFSFDGTYINSYANELYEGYNLNDINISRTFYMTTDVDGLGIASRFMPLVGKFRRSSGELTVNSINNPELDDIGQYMSSLLKNFNEGKRFSLPIMIYGLDTIDLELYVCMKNANYVYIVAVSPDGNIKKVYSTNYPKVFDSEAETIPYIWSISAIRNEEGIIFAILYTTNEISRVFLYNIIA